MNKPDEYEILERAHEAAGVHMMQKSPRADELIACLEGEIAKRDARIVELEADRESWADRWVKAVNYGARLASELSAIRAQEPVIDAPYGGILRIEAGNLPDSLVRINPCKFYAAPVSEAKAQGVVMPARQSPDDEWHSVMKDRSIGWNAALDEVAHLNAAPVQQDQAFCEYCGGNDEEPQDHCMDCTRPVQQVSVPDWWEDRIFAAMQEAFEIGRLKGGGMCVDDTQVGVEFACNQIRTMLAAAPAAPAADAGLVEALKTIAQWRLPETGQFWPSGGPVSYEAQHGSNGARDYMRGVAQAALAAHRDQGVKS